MAENNIKKFQSDAKNHQLHLKVAEAISKKIHGRGELLRDPACGGKQQLPLFIDDRKRRDTRMCCVDLLVIKSGNVKVIIEIEESGFLPTKICGKFLQSAIANYYIHESSLEKKYPYADEVLFIQVLDGSKFPEGSRKRDQGNLIKDKIQERLPLKNSTISYYRLFFDNELAEVGDTVLKFLV